jgi:voltage-gated potassium channel
MNPVRGIGVSVRSMPGVRRPNLIERRLSRFMRDPASVRNAASVIVGATAAIVIVGGVAIRALDSHEYASIWEGMWWALQTITTVGYGDVTPTTTAGKLVGVVIMLQGVAFMVIVTAAVTSTFVARAQALRGADDAADDGLGTQRVDDRLQDIAARLDRLERMLSKPS